MKLIERYHRIIGIFLILAILSGGGGVIWKRQKSNSESPKQLNNQPVLEINHSSSNAQNLNLKNAVININTASQEQLETLPGIGPTKAKAIIDYRQKYGKFKAKKDIIKVKGIGEKTYEKIQNLIEVD
jgi:competence protein ComEA